MDKQTIENLEIEFFEPRNLLPEFEDEYLDEGWTLDMNGNPHYIYYINNVECIMWYYVDLFFSWKYGNIFYRVNDNYEVFNLDNHYVGIFDEFGDLQRMN